MRANRVGFIAAGLALTVLAACVDESTAPTHEGPRLAKVDPCSPDAPPGQSVKCEDPGNPPASQDHLPPVASDEMVSPLRLDRTLPGWLLATDSRLGMVLRIDPQTRRPSEGFRTRGKPLGVTALGTSIYVGNADRGTIDVHRTNGGGFTASFGPGVVLSPADLAADAAAGLVFALDAARREVRVFSPWGDLLQVISGPGSGESELMNPTALAVDPARQWVLVSDYGSADTGPASLKVFDYAGGFVHELSGAGRCGMLGCSGGFSTPQGADVDAYGRIFLPDVLLAQVLVIDPLDWSLVQVVGDRSFVRVPTDVVFGDAGDLFIASSRTGEVEVMRGAGAQ